LTSSSSDSFRFFSDRLGGINVKVVMIRSNSDGSIDDGKVAKEEEDSLEPAVDVVVVVVEVNGDGDGDDFDITDDGGGAFAS